MEKPIPIDEGIFIADDTTIMVKTDNRGVIEYASKDYIKYGGYEVYEIIGEDIAVLMHPDVPSTIFDHIWGSLFQKNRCYAILKNISKSGKFFWLQANFDFTVNEESREIESIYAYYSKVSDEAINELDSFYKKIKNIEIHSGVEISESYLEGYLDEHNMTFSTFISQFLVK